MPFGSVNLEAGVDDKGERYIWLPRAVVDRLKALRAPGESYSDVMLRLVEMEGACALKISCNDQEDQFRWRPCR